MQSFLGSAYLALSLPNPAVERYADQAADQAARPATESVLFVAKAGQDGASTHHQETTKVGVTGFGDPPQS